MTPSPVTIQPALDAVELPYAVIAIDGPEAAKLLQGQTSIDIDRLPLLGVSYGTANTAKGRLYGLFRIVRTESGFLLRIQRDCADHFLTQLSKYAAFFTCSLTRTSQRVRGLFDAPGPALPPQGSELAASTAQGLLLPCRGAPTRYELITTDAPDQDAEPDPEHWFALESQNGLPELYPETRDRFILQQLNLHRLGAVSFDKGCYTGQEIIARMKYLGTLKKRMFLLYSAQTARTRPGADVFDAAGAKCGEVVRSHYSPLTGSVTLAVLDQTFAQTRPQVFLMPEGPVPFEVLPLPQDEPGAR
jgi:folate-binding protein YgfZ